MLSFTFKLLEAGDEHFMRIYKEYANGKEKLDQLSGGKLLQMFSQFKGTGHKKPGLFVTTCTMYTA